MSVTVHQRMGRRTAHGGPYEEAGEGGVEGLCVGRGVESVIYHLRGRMMEVSVGS